VRKAREPNDKLGRATDKTLALQCITEITLTVVRGLEREEDSK